MGQQAFLQFWDQISNTQGAAWFGAFVLEVVSALGYFVAGMVAAWFVFRYIRKALGWARLFI